MNNRARIDSIDSARSKSIAVSPRSTNYLQAGEKRIVVVLNNTVFSNVVRALGMLVDMILNVLEW